MNSGIRYVPVRGKTKILGDYLDILSGTPQISIDSMPKLNKKIFGLQKQKLVIVGARPSECKSGFCLSLAYDLSITHKVLFLSLEMTETEAMFRLLCHASKIPNTELYEGKKNIYKPNIDLFYKQLEEENRKLIICEEIGKTWKEVNLIMEDSAFSGDNKPDIIFLDYIQCIKTQGSKLEQIEDYIRNFRRLAIEKDICVIVCSQINRTNIVNTKEPTMEGLKSTGFLEEHADKVLLLYYPCKRSQEISKNDFRVIIAKNKNGMTGYHDMNIEPSTYTFTEKEEATLKTQESNEPERVDWDD